MTYEIGPERFNSAQYETAYLRRRAREEAGAAASASTIAATLLHVELATAYAQRCCNAQDQAWVAEHRVW